MTEPPTERTAWCDPDDRDGLATMLLECARDTIARVGWGEFENKAADPTDAENCPPLWRKTPRMGSRWAGHVWDACTIEDQRFSPDSLLRLTVRCVDWQLNGAQADTHFGLSSADQARLQPHIPPDIEDDHYSLIHAWDLKRPVVLHIRDDWDDVRDAGNRTLAPDDRDAIEKVLTAEATSAIEEWEADFDVPS